MDRLRAGSPVYGRQQSGGSSSTGSSSPGGGVSPAHQRSPLMAPGAGISNIKRTQNVAARAAAARLAQVMASQNAVGGDDDEDYDDDDMAINGRHGGASVAPLRFGMRPVPTGSSNGGSGAAASLLGRGNRSPSPATGRTPVEPSPGVRSTSAGRPAVTVRPTTVTMVPAIKTTAMAATLKTPSPIPPVEVQVDTIKNRRLPTDGGHRVAKEPGFRRDASALQDELDMLQEENEKILEKLRLAEEKYDEADARAKELEKQVATLGEGVSLEARLLSRKEASLRQREAALKAARESTDGRADEITYLKRELQSAKEEAASAVNQLKAAESETNALQSMTQRMILTQEEMEEVVLKRCWLARYWGLAVHYGIYPEIAVSKHEHWSALAPLPLEVVLSAGQKAKEEPRIRGEDSSGKRNRHVRDMSDVMGEGNIERMLSVEFGLRELASLKVEDAVVIALGQQRRPNLGRQLTSDFKAPGEPKFFESFELSYEEAEDVSFKQSWLIYFWRRAKTHGVEEDIADERLQFWMSRISQAPTSHDAIDVERGLSELRKLGIEQQLWESSRRQNDHTPSSKQDLS